MAERLLGCRVTAGQSGRADRVVQALTGVSRAWVRGLFDDDRVTINARPAPDPAAQVADGDMVEVRFDPHTRCHARPRERVDPAFRVLFEDEHVIVVDKAAFVLTIPTDKMEADTLVDRVARHLGRGGRERRPHVVQRLDRGTSGVIIFAVTRAAAVELIRQFRRHEPTREYLALLAGSLREDRGTIQTRLATSRGLSRYSVRDGEAGEVAVTHFEVEARHPGATLVRVRLETGRRNQIRVHFAEAGHPVLGDPRYAPERARHPRWRARRLALHASVLGLHHPVTGEELWFESPLPEEFGRFEVARGHRGS
ncbi:MAG: RluA family pseudouridine synthase [Candidatus Eisenbacteria bacterium]|nr:RluA family pseudouridine synthase [Candidatus Eisenbacteria bacterium]